MKNSVKSVPADGQKGVSLVGGSLFLVAYPLNRTMDDVFPEHGRIRFDQEKVIDVSAKSTVFTMSVRGMTMKKEGTQQCAHPKPISKGRRVDRENISYPKVVWKACNSSSQGPKGRQFGPCGSTKRALKSTAWVAKMTRFDRADLGGHVGPTNKPTAQKLTSASHVDQSGSKIPPG